MELGKKIQKYLHKYMTIIDSTYNNFSKNKSELLIRLNRIETEIEAEFRRDKFSEDHYRILQNKITEYTDKIAEV
jgi:hypothetical protein